MFALHAKFSSASHVILWGLHHKFASWIVNSLERQVHCTFSDQGSSRNRPPYNSISLTSSTALASLKKHDPSPPSLSMGNTPTKWCMYLSVLGRHHEAPHLEPNHPLPPCTSLGSPGRSFTLPSCFCTPQASSRKPPPSMVGLPRHGYAALCHYELYTIANLETHWKTNSQSPSRGRYHWMLTTSQLSTSPQTWSITTLAHSTSAAHPDQWTSSWTSLSV